MVRLRDSLRLSWAGLSHISIPTWYDWESGCRLPTQKAQSYFNSNMVRLRGPHWRWWPKSDVLFQFQHGTIEREKGDFCLESYIDFNSNMVRLRVKHRHRRLQARNVFQFQHGTIESHFGVVLCQRIGHFNSNMVRLREPPCVDFVFIFSTFQFQHGTIEREPVA